MVKIAVDAFGGDNAPLEIMRGSADAVKEYGVEVVLVGDSAKIEQVAKDENIDMKGMIIVDAPNVMPVDEEPTKLTKDYKDSSLYVAFDLVAKGECDALVSAGSTGAITVGSTLITKRMKGIKRVAIACIVPNGSPLGHFMIVDAGANSECRPEMLQQFGVMGSIYMKLAMNVERPRVGLVNIGTEECKGTQLQIDAYPLLEKAPLYFIGNVEARELPTGGCDVAVCDGFTGNIVLKTVEGMGKMFKDELINIFMPSFITKLGAVMVGSQLKKIKVKFDHRTTGGAIIIGTKKLVVKAHGSSDAFAFKNAIRQAKVAHENKVIAGIEEAMEVVIKLEEENKARENKAD